MKTHPMWNPDEPTCADAEEVVGAAFAAGLRPDTVADDPMAVDLPPEFIEGHQ